MAKNYDQYCPMAHALDMVGDRWELLIVRELLHGPKRYTDLAEGLPGIGTNILAARLRDLEADGVVTKKTLPPPAASRVYELTDYGLELKPVMRELALWGARSLGPPTAEDELFPGWLLNPVEMILGPLAPLGRFEFRVGDEIASLIAAPNGSIATVCSPVSRKADWPNQRMRIPLRSSSYATSGRGATSISFSSSSRSPSTSTSSSRRSTKR